MVGGLASLGSQPPISTATPQPTPQPRGASHHKKESVAPKLVSAKKKKRGNEERVQKVAVLGPAGTGKTYTIFSLVKHLAIKNKLRPEQIRIEVIDLDGGLDELTDQSIIPDEFLDRIFISTCQSFAQVVDSTNESFVRLHEHKRDHGIAGSWIVVDNMEKSWQYPQEDYCLTVYEMTLAERMAYVRKKNMELKAQGQKGEAVFNQNLDWSIISPMYLTWAKSFETCGINFLWLSPWKPDEVKSTDGTIIEIREKFGQGGNNLKVSHIIRKYFDISGNRCAEFIKSRSTKGLPKNMRKTGWTDMFDQLENLEVLEQRQKITDMKTEGYVYDDQDIFEPESQQPVTSPQIDDAWASQPESFADVLGVSSAVKEQAKKDEVTERIMKEAVEYSSAQAEKSKADTDLPW